MLWWPNKNHKLPVKQLHSMTLSQHHIIYTPNSNTKNTTTSHRISTSYFQYWCKGCTMDHQQSSISRRKNILYIYQSVKLHHHHHDQLTKQYRNCQHNTPRQWRPTTHQNLITHHIKSHLSRRKINQSTSNTFERKGWYTHHVYTPKQGARTDQNSICIASSTQHQRHTLPTMTSNNHTKKLFCQLPRTQCKHNPCHHSGKWLSKTVSTITFMNTPKLRYGSWQNTWHMRWWYRWGWDKKSHRNHPQRQCWLFTRPK